MILYGLLLRPSERERERVPCTQLPVQKKTRSGGDPQTTSPSPLTEHGTAVARLRFVQQSPAVGFYFSTPSVPRWPSVSVGCEPAPHEGTVRALHNNKMEPSLDFDLILI